MLARLVAAGSLAIVAACAGEGGTGDATPNAAPQATTASGIEGRIKATPVDAGCAATQSCDRPLTATFNVEQNGGRVGQFTTDADGRFSILLPPGHYVITPDPSAPLINPLGQTRPVTVGANRMNQVLLTFQDMTR